MRGIAEFILARVAEDEQAARGAVGRHWDASAFQQVRTATGDDPSYYRVVGMGGVREHWDSPELLEVGTLYQHIARHDPARVLAECASKREVLVWHGFLFNDLDPAPICMGDRGVYPCPTLRALAAIWSDHPEYDPSWAVEASA